MIVHGNIDLHAPFPALLFGFPSLVADCGDGWWLVAVSWDSCAFPREEGAASWDWNRHGSRTAGGWTYSLRGTVHTCFVEVEVASIDASVRLSVPPHCLRRGNVLGSRHKQFLLSDPVGLLEKKDGSSVVSAWPLFRINVLIFIIAVIAESSQLFYTSTRIPLGVSTGSSRPNDVVARSHS